MLHDEGKPKLYLFMEGYCKRFWEVPIWSELFLFQKKCYLVRFESSQPIDRVCKGIFFCWGGGGQKTCGSEPWSADLVINKAATQQLPLYRCQDLMQISECSGPIKLESHTG